MDSHSTIRFYPYKLSLETNTAGYLSLIREGTGVSIKVTPDVVDAMRYLESGLSLRDAADKSGIDEKELTGIIMSLQEEGLVSGIDGVQAEDKAERIRPWLAWIPDRCFSWMASSIVISAMAICIAVGLIVWFLHPDFYPSYELFFWSRDYFLVFLSIYVMNFFLVVMHELTHYIATRAIGGQARMRMSTRYLFLVAETDSYYLSIAPKKERYKVYLSGIFFDLFIACCIIPGLSYADSAGFYLGIYRGLLLAIVMAQVLRIIWQFNIFVETDIYNFLSECLGEENLMENAKKELMIRLKNAHAAFLAPIRKIVKQIIRKEDIIYGDDLRSLSKRDHRLIDIYYWVLIIGFILATINFAAIILPRDIAMLFRAVDGLRGAIAEKDYYGFFKAGLFLILFLMQYILMLVLLLDRREKKIKEKKVTG